MDDEKLIKLVSEQPTLYAKHSPLYKNVPMRRKLWADIANEIGCDLDLCMRRWVQLRERYCKEMRLAKAASDRGSTPRMRWPHFKAMGFLSSHITTRHQKTNFCLSDESIVTEEIIVGLSPTSSDPLSPISTTANSPACSQVGKKRKLPERDIAFMEAANSIKKMCDRQSEAESPALKDFAKMLVTYLAKLPESAQLQLISSITQQMAEVIKNYE